MTVVFPRELLKEALDPANAPDQILQFPLHIQEIVDCPVEAVTTEQYTSLLDYLMVLQQELATAQTSQFRKLVKQQIYLITDKRIDIAQYR